MQGEGQFRVETPSLNTIFPLFFFSRASKCIYHLIQVISIRIEKCYINVKYLYCVEKKFTFLFSRQRKIFSGCSCIFQCVAIDKLIWRLRVATWYLVSTAERYSCFVTCAISRCSLVERSRIA